MIKKLKDSDNVVRDRYKIYEPNIPSHGGIVVLFATFFTIITMSLWFRIINRITDISGFPKSLTETDMAIMLVIAMFAIYGIVDDLIDIGHLAKVVLPFFFSYPLLLIITPEHLSLPIIGDVDFGANVEFPVFGEVYVSTIVRGILMPLFIIVITNLVNMHSGFNGLQTGLSSMILATIIIKSILDDGMGPMLVPAAVFGGFFALWFFNKYPARILEGNIGSLLAGSTIGCILIVQGYLIFGTIIFIPHIIDFLMFISLKLRKMDFVKFGKLRYDGTIEAPNPWKLKFLFPYYFPLTEKQTVLSLYGLTGIFCIIGLIIT